MCYVLIRSFTFNELTLVWQLMTTEHHMCITFCSLYFLFPSVMFRRVRQVRVHIYLLSVQENSVPLNIWWNGDDILDVLECVYIA